MYDVVVAGGGPVGSHIACKLAEAGHSVVVLEKKPSLEKKTKTCTGIISRECANSFVIGEAAILMAVNSARLFSPSGGELRLRREETQAYILDRSAFDTVMASRAQSKGVKYVMGSPVSSITTEADRVRVRATNGAELDFEARAAVIATGFGSRLSEHVGLGWFGDHAIGAQTEVVTRGVNEVEVYFGHDIAPGFFAWLVPTSPQTARLGLLSRRSPGLHLRKLMASLLAQGKIASAEAEPHYGGVPLKPLRRTYRQRLIVAGDAAGQVKPTSGGGIYYGLLCADIAADTLHQALEADDLSASRLARYEQAWRQRLGQELKVDYWARKLFERLSDKQIDRAFEIASDRGINDAMLKTKDLSFDWHSQAILKLVGYRAIAKAIGLIGLPFKVGGN